MDLNHDNQMGAGTNLIRDQTLAPVRHIDVS
jgi:hypothetical protein